jgi:F0F1-type ATP synthase membrane subunit b/b'
MAGDEWKGFRMLISLSCFVVLSIAASIYFGWKYRAISVRFAPVLSLDEEAERVRRQTEKQKADTLREIETAKTECAGVVATAKANPSSSRFR